MTENWDRGAKEWKIIKPWRIKHRIKDKKVNKYVFLLSSKNLVTQILAILALE